MVNFTSLQLKKHKKVIVVGLYDTLNLMGHYIIGRNSILGTKAASL
jgi:hypothetical protein